MGKAKREKQKLEREQRNKPNYPDMRDEQAVQRYFLEEIQLGEELMMKGEVEDAVTPTDPTTRGDEASSPEVPPGGQRDDGCFWNPSHRCKRRRRSTGWGNRQTINWCAQQQKNYYFTRRR